MSTTHTPAASSGASSASADASAAAPPATGATLRRDCPLCGGARRETILRHDPWQMARCETCDLLYLPEIPSEAAVETDFEWEESFKRERRERWMRNPFVRAWTALTVLIRPSREGRALRRIRRFAPRGRFLDVGCGDGRLAALAQRKGYDAVGVELSPRMAARARRRMAAERVLCGRLADFDLSAESFDVAVLISYLEHEPQPLEVLRRIAALLRSGGACVVKVPNYDSRLRSLRGESWAGFRWPEHVQYFTPATLRAMLEKAGLRVEHVDANPLSDNQWMFARRA